MKSHIMSTNSTISIIEMWYIGKNSNGISPFDSDLNECMISKKTSRFERKKRKSFEQKHHLLKYACVQFAWIVCRFETNGNVQKGTQTNTKP